MEKPARGVEGLLGQLKSASKQKRFIQPLIVGFWFLVWTSMELNQDFRIVQQLMHSFDDPFECVIAQCCGGWFLNENWQAVR